MKILYAVIFFAVKLQNYRVAPESIDSGENLFWKKEHFWQIHLSIFLCTVIFTNLLVLSNTLGAINHKIVKALYQKMQSSMKMQSHRTFAP